MNNLLQSAINDEKNTDFTFFLSGDLCQMSNQRRFLNENGIETKQNNVYPCLMQKDISKALTLIWTLKCDGWWHYRDNYILYGICTEEDFNNRLKRY